MMWHETSGPGPGLSKPGSASVGDGAETVLYQAALDARAGRHEPALALLDRLERGGGAPTPAALDLRARICAQLGFALEAERLWSLAAETDPGNPVYALALTRLRGVRRPGPRVWGLIVSVGAGVVLLWLLGQGLQIATAVSDMRVQLAANADLAQSGLNAAQQGVDELRGDTHQAFGEVRTSIAAVKAQLAANANSAQDGLNAIRQGVEELRGDTRQSLGEVRGAVSDMNAQLNASTDSAQGELSAVRQGMEALRGDTQQALGEVRTSVAAVKAQLAANANSGQDGLNAIRQGVEELRGDTQQALDEFRTAIAVVTNHADTASALRARDVASEAPEPAQATGADIQVVDPGVLIDPAESRERTLP